jgi:hypothetical protein
MRFKYSKIKSMQICQIKNLGQTTLVLTRIIHLHINTNTAILYLISFAIILLFARAFQAMKIF